MVGIPTYGMSFTLGSEKETGLKAAAIGGGKKGPHTGEEGILSYAEVRSKVMNSHSYQHVIAGMRCMFVYVCILGVLN